MYQVFTFKKLEEIDCLFCEKNGRVINYIIQIFQKVGDESFFRAKVLETRRYNLYQSLLNTDSQNNDLMCSYSQDEILVDVTTLLDVGEEAFLGTKAYSKESFVDLIIQSTKALYEQLRAC